MTWAGQIWWPELPFLSTDIKQQLCFTDTIISIILQYGHLGLLFPSVPCFHTAFPLISLFLHTLLFLLLVTKLLLSVAHCVSLFLSVCDSLFHFYFISWKDLPLFPLLTLCSSPSALWEKGKCVLFFVLEVDVDGCKWGVWDTHTGFTVNVFNTCFIKL